MSQHTPEFRISDEFTDVTLIVDEMRFQVHKSVLAAKSNYFKKILYGRTQDSNEQNIELEDISSNVFQQILSYMYTDSIDLPALNEDALIDVLYQANRFKMLKLESNIHRRLIQCMTVENICRIINAARSYNLENCLNLCKIFADRHASEILKHTSFINLTMDSLYELLLRDSFFASEIEIYRAMNRWCEANFRVFEENTDYDEADVMADCVRLYLLSMEELCMINKSITFVTSEMIVKAAQDKSLKKYSDLNHRGRLWVDENLAHEKYGSKVIAGTKPETLLRDTSAYNIETGFTTHNITDESDPGIVVKLEYPSIINHIKLLLWDIDLRVYSYFIEVSIDNENWTRIVDYTAYDCRSWQRLYFEDNILQFIKIVGTKSSKDDAKFRLVSLEAKYLQNIPQFIDDILNPDYNVATLASNAIVLEGRSEIKNKLLDGDLEQYDFNITWHFIGEGGIIIQLAQPYIIDSIKMRLLDSEGKSYSYCIDTSINKIDWERAVDRNEESYSSWQVIRFEPRSVIYVKIVGTASFVNGLFEMIHFECPTQDTNVTPLIAEDEPS